MGNRVIPVVRSYCRSRDRFSVSINGNNRS